MQARGIAAGGGGGTAPGQGRTINGQPQPPYAIPASHSSHPQHQAWLHAQQPQAGAGGTPQGPMQPPYHHMQQSLAPNGLPINPGAGSHPSICVNTQLGGPHSAAGPMSAPPIHSGAIAPSPHALNARPLPSPASTHASAGFGPGGPQRPGPPLHSNSYPGPLPPDSGRESPAMMDPRGPPPLPSTAPQTFRQLPSAAAMRPPPTAAHTARSELIYAAHLAAQGNGPVTATAAAVGPALAKLTAFSEAVNVALEQSQVLEALRAVVANFFTDTAVLKYGLYDPVAGLNKVFEIPCAAFPRFHHINALAGAIASTFSQQYIREFFLTTPVPHSSSEPALEPPPQCPPGRPIHVGYLLRADEAVWHHRWSNGVKVELTGTLTMHFVVTANPGAGGAGSGTVPPLRIESVEFEARGHEEFASMQDAFVYERIERLFDLSTPDEQAATHEGEGSPPLGRGHRQGRRVSGSGVLTRRKSAGRVGVGASGDGDDPDSSDPKKGHVLPKSAPWPTERAPGLHGVVYEKMHPPAGIVGSFGITEMGMRCLEIAESVAQLHELIGFSLETGMGPIQSLARYADHHRPRPTYPASQYETLGVPMHPPQQNGHSPSMVHTLPPSSGAVIASTTQNPSTNTFYASATVPPPPSLMNDVRPPSRQLQHQHQDSPPGPAVAGTKRKAGGQPPPRTPTPSQAEMNGIEYNTSSAGSSPKKTGGARGRGRGRGARAAG